MIEVKDAVKAAHQFVSDLFSEPLPDLRLEEVARSEDDKFWLITLGFNQQVQASSALQAALSPRTERIYKSIKVDAETGRPVAMQIRKL